MPKVFLPLGKMNLEKGPMDGDHSWVIKDLLPTDHGYESAPVVSFVNSFTSTGTGNPKGGINWRGTGSPRMYVGVTSQIYEMWASSENDVSRTTGAYSNDTYGPSFASYGSKCYMSNGVDRINSITVPATRGGTENFSDITYTTDGAVISPKYICSHKNHLIGANVHMLEGYGEIDSFTTAVGNDFPNQPNNDGIEFLSTDAGDTDILTIVGTVFGTDTTRIENKALSGLSVVSSGFTNWGKILRLTIQSAIAGTVTVRKATGDATIATFLTLGTGQSQGVNTANISGGSSYVTLVASVGSTAQVGIEGTDDEGQLIYDSQALTGTTPVSSNLKFKTVTFIDTGDVEVTDTVTVTSHQFGMNDDYEYLVWISGTDLPEGYGDPQVAPQIPGSDYRYLFDGLGKITGVIDGGDCFFVFKSGSIVRLDGPPFQPTVINYNIGMRAGGIPYRQGDRIYFWSSKGLSYVSTINNEVVHVFSNSMQRSILDSGNVAAGINVGTFPDQNVSSLTLANASCKSAFATISGDPEYGLIFVGYYNDGYSYGNSNNNMLLYNEELDAFSLINGPTGTPTSPPFLLSFDNDQPASFPGSVVRIFRVTASNTMTMYKLDVGALLFVEYEAPYVRLPFKSVDPDKARTRITKVKPVFNNGSIDDGTPWTFNGTKVEILSISGTGKSWPYQAVFSASDGTVSLDGWYDVSSCTFADKHSIGMHFTGARALGGNPRDAYITDLIGFEVEYVQEAGRSL